MVFCTTNSTTYLGSSLQVHVVNTHASTANHLEAALGRLKHLARDLQGRVCVHCVYLCE